VERARRSSLGQETVSMLRLRRAAGPSLPLAAAGEDRPAHGIGFALLAMALFTFQDAIIKLLAADYSIFQLLFLRSLLMVPPCLVYLRLAGASWWPRRPGAVLLRCIFGFLAWVCFFAALREMPLADVIAITFAAPLCVTALSVPLLGEAVGLRRWLATLVGFAGVLIIVRPGGEMFGPAAGLALLATLFYALSVVMIRDQAKSETSALLLLSGVVVNLGLSALAQPLVWITPDLPALALMTVIGLTAGIGQFAMIQAYRFAPAAVVAPFDYTALIWAVLFGWLLFADLPGAAVLSGAAIVVASGLYTFQRETRGRPAASPT
jgi:drug/metabolite transporter (DMT)-like permease